MTLVSEIILYNFTVVNKWKGIKTILALCSFPKVPYHIGWVSHPFFYTAVDAGFHSPLKTMSCSLLLLLFKIDLSRKALRTIPKNTSFRSDGFAGRAQTLSYYLKSNLLRCQSRVWQFCALEPGSLKRAPGRCCIHLNHRITQNLL